MSENKQIRILKGRPVEGQTVKMAIPVKKTLFNDAQVPAVLRLSANVDLTKLVANGYVDCIYVFQMDCRYHAQVVLNGNDIVVSGEGLNILIAVENLNKNIIDMNFEF